MRKATIQDRAHVVDILTDTFINLKHENSISFIVKQDHKYEARTRFLMSYLFDTYINQEHIYLDDNQKAVLIVSVSNQERFTFKKLFQSIQLVFGVIGLSRLLSVLKRQYILKKNHPNYPHIKPVILAVHPNHQDRGIGGRLVLNVLRENKSNQLPIVINTATYDNVIFYQKFGFRLTHKTEELGYPFYFLEKK